MLRHTLLRCSLLCRRSSAAVAAATASNRGSYRSQSTSARELLSGVFAPIPTPFSLDKPNELDLPRLSTNLARWLGSGAADKLRMVDGVCVMGSNGEFPLLREAEKRALLAHVSAQVRSIDGDGSVRLIAGTGSVSTLETIELTQFAADHGYDAAMVVTPYYYTSRMTQARLAQHFIAVANAASIPIILYSMPSFAGGLSIDKELVVQLAKHPNIIGMKDSSGNVANLKELVGATTEYDFAMLAGTGSVFYECLTHGATGGIMAQANVMGDKLRYLHRLFKHVGASASGAEKHEQGLRLNTLLAPVNALLTAKYSVPGLKYALDASKMYGGPVRMPFLQLKENEALEIEAAMRQLETEWKSAITAAPSV